MLRVSMEAPKWLKFQWVPIIYAFVEKYENIHSIHNKYIQLANLADDKLVV